MSDSKFVLSRRKFLLGLAGGFGLSSWSMPEAQAFQPFEPFSFAYISDVHLTNELPDSFILTHESQLFLQQLVKEVNDERVDFVMFGGDQVETPGKGEVNWNLFCEIANGLAAPWTFILGDRDVSGDYGVDKIRTYGADWKDSGIKTNTSYWSRNPEFAPNVHLVGLDTSLPNTTVGGMSGRQLEWLKQDLTDNKRMFTIVFAHHPLLPPPPYDGGPPWDDYVIPDGGSVREVLAPNPQVKLVLSGHVHVTKVQPERDIWHVANPSLTVFPCGYRIFRVSPQRIEMETRQIQFPALVKKARKALLDSTMASRYSRSNPESFVSIVEGGRDDRDAIIPLIPGRQLEPYNPKKAAKQRGKDSPEASQKQDPKGKSEQQGKGDSKGEKNKPKGSNEPEEEEKGGLFRRKKRRNEQQQPKSNDVQPPKKNAEPVGKQPADQDADESPDGSNVPDEGRMPADESGKSNGGNSTDKDKSGKSSGGNLTDKDKSGKQSGSSGSGKSDRDLNKDNGEPSEPESDTSSDDQPKGNSANQSGGGKSQPKSNDSGSGKSQPKSNESGSSKTQPKSDDSGGSKAQPKSNDSGGGKPQPKKSNDSDSDGNGNNPDDSSANTGKSSVDKSPAVPEPKAPSVKPKAKKAAPPEDETSKVEPAKPEDIDKLLNSPSNEKSNPPAEAPPEPPASSDETPRRKRKK